MREWCQNMTLTSSMLGKHKTTLDRGLACDAENHLTGGKTATFRYDGDGKLVLMSVRYQVRRTYEVRRTSKCAAPQHT